MYNSIYPININYHNQYRKNSDKPSDAQNTPSHESSSNQTFPNGTKVAIDYTKGQINISQVLTDFRSTIIAINAPDDVKEEVGLYLGLVEKESHKENPSREIIVSNLKNASRVSDAYISSALNKPSDVVEKWIDTLFLQKINLKADPNEINPDFQLEFPKTAQEKIDAQKLDESKEISFETPQSEVKITELETSVEEIEPQQPVYEDNELDIESDFELSQDDLDESKQENSFSPTCDADIRARILFVQAKNMPQTNDGDINAINLLNEALGIMAQDENANQNIRAAIHIERGKIFDNYDYVDYALRDYYEATKADDYNLKAQAYYKSGQIYDEFSEFYPAMDNYLSSVAYSAEADNADAQTRVLSKISSLFTRQYDKQNALQYGDLAIDTAKETNNEALIADTYSNDAQNSQYLGENDRAIDSYKNALSIFSRTDESYEQMAYNYEQAANVMRKLGNHAKAAKLQLKANQYYQKVQLQQLQLEEAS